MRSLIRGRHAGPQVRFVWGISGDDRLNHHPEPPPGIPREEWPRAPFRTGGPPFHLRVERQVLWPLPEVGASLFAIRVSFWRAEEIAADPRKRELLRRGLLSMSPESRRYKGVDGCFDELVRWLEE
jgi:hypothetical protein